MGSITNLQSGSGCKRKTPVPKFVDFETSVCKPIQHPRYHSNCDDTSPLFEVKQPLCLYAAYTGGFYSPDGFLSSGSEATNRNLVPTAHTNRCLSGETLTSALFVIAFILN
jgi:hypothetical protein